MPGRSEDSTGPGHDSVDVYRWAAQRFSELFAWLPVACYSVDRDHNVVEWNGEAAKLFGTEAVHAVQHPAVQTAFRGQEEPATRFIESVLGGHGVEDWERDALGPNGFRLHLVTRARPLFGNDGSIVGVLVAELDLTRQRALAGELAESKRFVERVMSTVPEFVYVYDLDRLEHVYTNRPLESVFGIEGPSGQVAGCALVNQRLHPEDWPAMRRHFELIKTVPDGEVLVHRSRAKHEDGSWRHLESRDSVFARDPDGRVVQIVGSLQDVTQRDRLQERLNEEIERTKMFARELEAANGLLRSIAVTDGLTGLDNHRGLQDALDRALANDEEFWLVLVDVDDFKSLNDQFGHHAGDETLRQFGRVLKRAAPADWTVARYGGEEFAFVCPSCSPAAVQDKVERVRRAVEEADWPLRSVTASFGAASSVHFGSKKRLIEAADQALYTSKSGGKNRVTVLEGADLERSA